MRSARLFVALLILVGVAGALISGASLYSRFIYIGLFLVLVSFLWGWVEVRSLQVERSSRTLRANVGDIFEEHFEVTNRGPWLNLWVEVLNASPLPFAAGSRLLTMVGGKQKRIYTARSWLTRRGAFPLGPTVLTCGDPFGLFRFRRQFPASATLIVLPMIFEIASFPQPPGLLPGGRVIRKKTMDVTPHAAGVREYVPGDPLKRIHWPTTLRQNRLMVKEFEEDPQAEVWLFLDAQQEVHFEKKERIAEQQAEDLLFKVDALLFGRRPPFRLPPSTLEYAVSITASLAHYFVQQRRAVGLATSGKADTIIPAERSQRQESKILETLAFVEARAARSLASLVTAQARHLPQGSSAILITPSTANDFLLAVEDLIRRKLRPVVVLLIADTFGGPKGSEDLARALAERNVPVCPIRCDDDLPQVLSAFASFTPSQEFRLWQRPPLSLWI
jgi:uncharacterized protein (DUF58 family)